MRKLGRAVVWTAIAIAIVVGIARATAIRWWRVPGNDPYLEAAVAPALAGRDLVILWRLTEPVYGDLVVCPEPGYPDRVVVGRILGEAGDKISVKGNDVFVNDRRNETERRCEEFVVTDPDLGVEVKQMCQIEAVGQLSYMRGSAAGQKKAAREIKMEVPPGNVFLVSDNRLFPYDSRDYGAVERNSCKESVVFRLVSRKGFFDVAKRFTLIQ